MLEIRHERYERARRIIWKRMEKIRRIDKVNQNQKDTVMSWRGKKHIEHYCQANWILRILSKNSLLYDDNEGKIEGLNAAN